MLIRRQVTCDKKVLKRSVDDYIKFASGLLSLLLSIIIPQCIYVVIIKNKSELNN